MAIFWYPIWVLNIEGFYMKRNLFLSLFVTVGLFVAGCFGMADRPCPICLGPIIVNLPADNPDVAMAMMPLFGCNHPDELFHAHCLVDWLEAQGDQAVCPLCRAPLFANLPAVVRKALLAQFAHHGVHAAPAPAPAHAPAPMPVHDLSEQELLWMAHIPAAAPAPAPVAGPANLPEPVPALVHVPAPAPAHAVVPAHVTDISQIMHCIRRDHAHFLSLDLAYSDVQIIDGHVFEQISMQFPNLENLELEGTLLEILPSEVGRLENLVGIGLRRSQLIALPPEIELLHNLRLITLFSTPLTNSPTPEWRVFRAQLRANNLRLTIMDDM